MSITTSDATAGAPTAVLEVEQLSRRFGDRVAVDGVSLRIAAGETYGLLGPNGAGKSTTIAMIVGILEPHGGTVTVSGTSIRAGRVPGKSSIGFVPQDVALYPEMTGRENLDFFARLQGMRGRARRERIDEVLAVTGLAERHDDRVSEYSGGMRRRLNIGAGLLHRPELLVLDEPTVGVDPQSRDAILAAVETLSGEGLAVLYTTHYMEEAERLCDRIGIIDQGRLLCEGTTAELVADIGERQQVVVSITGGTPPVDRLRVVDGVHEVQFDDNVLRVLVDDASKRFVGIVAAIGEAGLDVATIEVERPDLEAVFLHLTGKALRE